MIQAKLKKVYIFVEGKHFLLTDLLDGVGYKYNPDTIVPVPSIDDAYDLRMFREKEEKEKNEQSKQNV